MPEINVMKFSMHIMPPEAISKHTSLIPPISNTNTEASQTVEEKL
jgi:hypothetical protein